jgi:demethylmenaquinone methyltransferase/2-methoxy-6-polyprenyl-1,4-benzoquinol methylase
MNEQANAAAAYIRSLEQADPLRAPVIQAAVAALDLPPRSCGLDVGCGIGLQAASLARAVGPGGGVTGLDYSAGLLAHARQRAEPGSGAGPVRFAQGDMRSLPFADRAFDWAWSADCAGYPAGDLLPVLKEMARVVRPGGTVAILAWSSQQVLPGHALLEARLNAACSPYAPFLEGKPPEAQFLRALRWFGQAGIAGAAARTLVGEARAPLEPEIRTALADLFAMLWGDARAAAEADRREWASVCRPDSPDCVLDRPEYYAFFTYTMFYGTVIDR